MRAASHLPGSEIVDPGLRDLRANFLSEEALVVLAAAPRLRRSGVSIDKDARELEASHQLYARLAERLGVLAHGRHHAMLRRVASYASAHAQLRER